MFRRRSSTTTLAAALTLAACAPVPGVAVSVSAPLTLDFSALAGRTGYGLMATRAVLRKATLTVSGPDLVPLVSATLDLAEASPWVTLPSVPAGPRRLVVVQGLDAGGQPVAGWVVRAIGAIVPGANTFALSGTSDAAGRIVEALAARDVTGSTHVGDTVDYAALDRAVGGYMRTLNAANPGLLDAAAVAADVYTANGAVPVSKSAYLFAPARLILSPLAWPPGATGIVSIDDPASPPTPVDGQPAVMGPVASGTWTLTLTPTQPGLGVMKQTLVVTAGQTQRVGIGFGAVEARTALLTPRGAAAGGALLNAGGTPILVLAGGSTRGVGALTDPVAAPDLVRYPIDAQFPPLALAQPTAGAASAVVENRLYWFGGANAAESFGTGWRYDSTGAVASRAPLPAGLKLVGAAGAALGTRIFVTGGRDDMGQNSSATFAYDTAADAWSAGLPPLAPHRWLATAASVGSSIYVFGGFGDDGLAAVRPFGTTRPTGDVSSLTPGTDISFRPLKAMPTPRAGAVAVTVGARIFVIGGMTRDGALSPAVEVYDPATDTWALRPPLGRGRVAAVAGLVGDRIVVAGGLLGRTPGQDTPLSDVEAIVP